MIVSKTSPNFQVSPDSLSDIDAINSFAKTQLAPDDVFTFSLILADNHVDRDFERFTSDTLQQLSALFVGKTGIFDHDWKASNQFARIFRTELVLNPDSVNPSGEPSTALKAHAYMLRNQHNSHIIDDINAGILKEVSIGCSVSKSLCSICGLDIASSDCSHILGRDYDGLLCFANLHDAVDAYEWSLVAVPAQRNAGITKLFGSSTSLKSFVNSDQGRQFAAEFDSLESLAAFGKASLDELRSEVLRLSLLCDDNLFSALDKASLSMSFSELKSLKTALDLQLYPKFPPLSQLPGKKSVTSFDDDNYLI